MSTTVVLLRLSSVSRATSDGSCPSVSLSCLLLVVLLLKVLYNSLAFDLPQILLLFCRGLIVLLDVILVRFSVCMDGLSKITVSSCLPSVVTSSSFARVHSEHKVGQLLPCGQCMGSVGSVIAVMFRSFLIASYASCFSMPICCKFWPEESCNIAEIAYSNGCSCVAGGSNAAAAAAAACVFSCAVTAASVVFMGAATCGESGRPVAPNPFAFVQSWCPAQMSHWSPWQCMQL